VLVIDESNAPVGWLAVDQVPDEALTGQVTPDLVNLGGTLAKQDGTLREALDSALSSPSGRGVVVDGDRRLLGTITAGEVLERIEQRAAASRTAGAQGGRAAS
jgi:osmoprotectant transport system ATP-binding protein